MTILYTQLCHARAGREILLILSNKKMELENLTHKIIGCAYKVYNHLGFGFLESVYKNSMIIELKNEGLKAEAEKPLKVYYNDQVVGEFFVDLYIDEQVIVELKAIQHLAQEHEIQLVNYLNCLKKEVGLLINFGLSGVEIKRKFRALKKSINNELMQNQQDIKNIFL